jgi:hypothetical protein
MSIAGNMIGSYSQIGKTFVIVDDNENELMGVCTEQEVIFDATAADIKIGKIAATDSGVTEGENTITYRTYHSTRLIRAGSAYTIPLSDYDQYDYTHLQCIIVLKNTSLSNSVAADKVVINDGVYQVGSINQISVVTKNAGTKSIDLNLINNTDETQYIRFFTYKDEEE